MSMLPESAATRYQMLSRSRSANAETRIRFIEHASCFFHIEPEYHAGPKCGDPTAI